MKGNLLRFIAVLIVSLGLSLDSHAQEDDYDYVLPESAELGDKSRSNVSLPIKAKSEDQNYIVPSYFENNEQALEALSEREEGEDKSKRNNRTSVNMEVGTSFSSDFKGNSAITTYAAPHIRHRVSSDIAISGGVILSQTFLNGWTDYSIDGSPMPSSITNATLYGSLEYQLNERVLLYGTIYQNIASMPEGFGHGSQTNGLGYSVGMNYKISEKSFLQIEFHRSSGYNPFSPYGRSVGFGGRPFSYFP